MPPCDIFRTLSATNLTNATSLWTNRSLVLKQSIAPGNHALSSESPRHSNSSIFFVMILVTSCRSSLSLSRLEPALAARVSWYSLAVLDMKVSGCRLVRSRSGERCERLQQPLTETNKCVWLPDGLYFWTIGIRELLCEFVEVRKCELSWIRLVRNSQVCDIIGYKVAAKDIDSRSRPRRV